MSNSDYAGFATLEEALERTEFTEQDIAENQVFMTPWQMVVRRFMRNKLAVIGMAALVAMLLFCYVAPFFYPYSSTEIFYLERDTGIELRTTDEDARIRDSVLNSLEKPSSRHILGTNKLGQDMLARLMEGGQVTMMVAFIVVIVELTIGIITGGLAGYFRGFVDMLVMRTVDIIYSVPTVPLLLIISSVLIQLKVPSEYKIYYTMFVLGAIYWTSVARLVRGNLLSLREMEFMQAAEATGITPWHQIMRHLIPNTLQNLIVTATLDLGAIIIFESTLSFLGVGVGAPYASWGNMVSLVADNQIMRDFPLVWVTPGVCILIMVLAFNFVGDGLRDATDPKMKR